MTNRLNKRPKCSQCGECCRAPMIQITKTSDYKRWVEQKRDDILKYASVPPLRGYGDLWMDIRETEDLEYCPFIEKISKDKFICTIHDTKPKVCKTFRCESCYGVGKNGVPFKTDSGWTDRAKQLGYGKPRNKENSEKQD
jgi:Fe-S-cluster containining protein